MSDTDLAFRATLDGSGFASGAQSINGHLHQMGIATNSATASLGPMGTILGSMASPLSLVALGATAVGGALAGSVQAAAAWESSMSGVAKTTGMAGPALAELSGELLEMSTNIPIAASELASIAQAGGSLGIAKEELAGFTEVAAQMGVGFEMSAAQAATAGAKILTAFQTDVSAENLRNLGNVVNKMGDDFPATEAQVLDFTNRASYLNTTFGMSVPAVAAWGTALISAGMESETAATGIKSLMNMSLDPKKFDAFAAAAGMSAEELKTALNEDVAGAYEMVAEKIAGGTDAVEKFQTVSKLAGTEGMTTLMKMGGAAYQGADALKKANAEWENGTSLAKTFAAQSETVNAQWTMFTNTVGVAATELGTVLLPVVGGVLEIMTEMTKGAIAAGEAIGGWYHDFQDTTLKESDQAFMDFLGVGTSEENQISAQEMATQTAGVYSDYLSAGIRDSEDIQSAPGDAIKSSETLAIEAAKQVAEATAKAFADEQAAYIKSHSSGGYSLATMMMMAGQDGSGDLNDKLHGSVEIGGGVFSRINYDINDQFTGYKLTTPTGKFEYANYEDFQSQAPKDLEQYVGRALTELERAEIMGDTREAIRLKANTEAKVEFDFSDITGDLRADMEAEAINVGEIGSQAAIDSYSRMLDLAREPTLDNLNAYLEEIRSQAREMGPMDIANFDVLGQDFKDRIASQIYDAEPVIKERMASLGDEAKKAFNGEFTEDERALLLAYEPQLQLLKDTFPEEFAAIGGDTSLALIDAIKAGDIPGALALIGQMAGEEFAKNLLGAAALVPKSLAELIADPDALKASAVDQSKFWEGTILPTIKRNADDAKAAFDSGQFTQAQVYENYIKPMSTLTDYMPGWVDDINSMFKSGQIDVDDYIYLLDEMTRKISDTNEKTKEQTSSVKDQTVGYDNLKKAMEGCSECAISEFGQWQEAQDGLFQDSYIGQGGQQYLDWKTQQVSDIAATQEAMRAAGGAVLGQDYTQEQQIKINADMSPAEADKAAFEATVAAANPEMKVSAITQAAMDEVNRLVSYIITVNPVMSVQVQVSAYAGEIRAIVESEVRAALA